MSTRFSESARRALVVAEQEARSLNHAFVGTEHLLLGLVHDTAGPAASALSTFGVDAGQIRESIEKLIQRGPAAVATSKLPLTPRAKRAIELADEDVNFLEQDQVADEHLLVGLLLEREGIAGQVLLGLGINTGNLARYVFKQRLAQMKFVERIVRPVRCTMARKRKMREELLAHLTAIYDEELSRPSNPDIAWHTTAERFGAPAELTCELQRSLSWSERVGYFVERCSGWRPPETANRWMARAAIQSSSLLALMNVGAGAIMIARFGWSESALIGMRPLLALLLLFPVLLFVLGAAYYQMRDSMYGAFGSRRSIAVAGGMAVLMGLSVVATLLAFVALTSAGFADRGYLIKIALAALATPLAALAIAHSVGREEIRDALWACMDIDPPRPSGPPPAEPA